MGQFSPSHWLIALVMMTPLVARLLANSSVSKPRKCGLLLPL